jgi:hypothetical protein
MPVSIGFQKFDQDKLRYELIPPDALRMVAEIFTMGARKYGARNWENATPEDHERIMGAAMRHIEDARAGIKVDPESGLPHLAHAVTNLFFLLHLENRTTPDFNDQGKA